MRRARFVLGFIVLLGCSSRHDRPPYYEPPPGIGGSGGYEVPIDTDCGEEQLSDAGICGNQTIQIQQDRPNLYFVLDASGSMNDPFDAASGPSKYTVARTAIADVLGRIGHRVSYGAAIFPKPQPFLDPTSTTPLPATVTCATGVETFPTHAGDPVACALAGKTGSVLNSLINQMKAHTPAGGTPLSATLSALVPTLTALSGKTAVILATDGDPNCNPDATCTPAMCETNLSHTQYPNGLTCEAPINCCDPSIDSDAPRNCIDDTATNQVLTSLSALSIPTYVIGLPSENLHSAVLDAMAVAGGTARAGTPRYYEADDADSLANALKTIATSVAVSCTIKLTQSPPNWAQVQVYFDGKRIPALTDDGWQRADASTLEITGSYCDDLMTGDVLQIQIIADCPVYVN